MIISSPPRLPACTGNGATACLPILSASPDVLQNRAFRAAHRAVDVTRNFLCGGEHQRISSNDVTTGHAEARMAKERLYRQFAEAQFMC